MVADVPETGRLLLGDATTSVDRIVTLPRIVSPLVRGLPAGADWFTPIDDYRLVRDTDGRVFAARDATDSPVKHGGLGAQQADSAAPGIAHFAGTAPRPDPLRQLIRSIVLTGERPLYLTARVLDGLGWALGGERSSSVARLGQGRRRRARALSRSSEIVNYHARHCIGRLWCVVAQTLDRRAAMPLLAAEASAILWLERSSRFSLDVACCAATIAAARVRASRRSRLWLSGASVQWLLQRVRLLERCFAMTQFASAGTLMVESGRWRELATQTPGRRKPGRAAMRSCRWGLSTAAEGRSITLPSTTLPGRGEASE